MITDEELEQLNEWESSLLVEASFYTGVTDPDSGEDKELRIFKDIFEPWEQPAIDGTDVDPPINLGDVRGNKQSPFGLQEKYKGLFFLGKDLCDDKRYYTKAGGSPLPREKWEDNRKILGLV